MRFSRFVFTCAVHFLLGSCIGHGQPTGNKEDLQSMLRLSTTLGDSLFPGDVSMVTHRHDDFEGDEPMNVGSFRSRLVIDDSHEFYTWAIESKRVLGMAPSLKGSNLMGKLNLSSQSARGRNGIAFLGGGRSIRKEHASFDVAMKEAEFPDPAFWFILPFPFLGDGELELERLCAMIAADNAAVFASTDEDEIEYRLVVTKSERVFDVHRWRFRVETLLPTKYQLNRSLGSGHARRYCEQDIFWEKTGVRHRPTAISREQGIVRPSRDRGTSEFDFGVLVEDTEFRWNRMEDLKDGIAELQPPTDEQSIIKFLDATDLSSRVRVTDK